MNINHGDTIVLRAYLFDGYTSYIRKQQYIPYISFNPYDNKNMAINWVVGDINKKGQTIQVGEPVLLQSNGVIIVGADCSYLSLLTDRKSSGKVIFCSGLGGNVTTDKAYRLELETLHQTIGKYNDPNFSALSISPTAIKCLFGIEKISENLTLTVQPTLPVQTVEKINALMCIDDSPTEYTKEIIEYCEKNDFYVALMLNGKQIEKHPDMMNLIVNSKNILPAVHTYSHMNYATQLQIWQVREEIHKTIDLINTAHAKNGKQWTGPKLFRFPFTDSGTGNKYTELQMLLAEFSFDVTEQIRKCQWGSQRRDIIGCFVEDGLYQKGAFSNKQKPKEEYKTYLNKWFEEMYGKFYLGWKTNGALMGSHDGSYNLDLLKFLTKKGFTFSKFW